MSLTNIKFALFMGSICMLTYLLNRVEPEKEVNTIPKFKLDNFENNDNPIYFLVVTRIHMNAATVMPAIDKVESFLKNAQTYAKHILICVGASKYEEIQGYVDKIKAEPRLQSMLTNVVFLPIFPWGYFTFSLNCAVQYAQDNKFKRIIFQSLEFKIEKTAVLKLLRYFDAYTLVVGPEISGHEFNEGIHDIKGRRCPWNTFAIWSVPYLSLTGFPMIGDGTGLNREMGGVEEVSTINLLQAIHPQLKAVLCKVQYSIETKLVSWNTSFEDLRRKNYHEKKMLTKDSRPEDQMKHSGIPRGKVIHVDLFSRDK